MRQANGKLIAETGGGSVDIQSCAQGAVIETGGNSITVRHCNGTVKASTGGGSVELNDIGGAAEIETGGGSIRLNSAKGHVHAETGGGGIELYSVPSASAETGAGGITVKLVNTGSDRRDSDLETGSRRHHGLSLASGCRRQRAGQCRYGQRLSTTSLPSFLTSTSAAKAVSGKPRR